MTLVNYATDRTEPNLEFECSLSLPSRPRNCLLTTHGLLVGQHLPAPSGLCIFQPNGSVPLPLTAVTIKLVALRSLLLGVFLSSALFAQFYGLSSTADGASVYFATTLRLRNTAEPRNAKIFVATRDGVSLFRAREPAFPPAD